MSGRHSQQRGRQAEQLAVDYLVRQGLHPVCRNFRCRPGEIDIIMLDGDCLVFVEVRLRRHQAYGMAVDSITPGKQRRLVNAARVFLQQHSDLGCLPGRFDVLCIQETDGDNRIDWIRDAFTAD